jgi:D-psicose/D-tagatose/L-ribulose 3-epimerase
MATIGINTFLWTTVWNDQTKRVLANVKAMGFDAVQIPILNLDTFDAKEIRRTTDELELTCYISAGLNEHNDITSESSDARRRGIEFLKKCVRLTCEAGAPFLSGSFHSVFGKKSAQPVGMEQWQRSADAIKEVAHCARQLNLPLALEPINRYESFLVNTADQARKLISMVGDDANIKIQLDTFHMNLEEEDFYHTITSLGDDLIHFHVAESHRGTFGQGMILWDQVFRALSEINYKGAIVIESFMPNVKDVALAACIWRQMAPSADVLASQGLKFIREWTAKYNL